MTWQDTFQIVVTGIAALGGGGAIVLAMSGWLGKLWADRLMERERARHARELEEMRAATEAQLERLRADLRVHGETALGAHADKLAAYRAAFDLVAAVLAEIERDLVGGAAAPRASVVHTFNLHRMRLYAYFGIHSPQAVMDANDRLMDLLLAILHDGAEYDWEKVRAAAVGLINEVRKDVGIDCTPIEYRGTR